MLHPGKAAAGREWCVFSRRRSIFIILVFAAVLFFYNTNLNKVVPDWYPHLWNQFKGQLLRTATNSTRFTPYTNSSSSPFTLNTTTPQEANTTAANWTAPVTAVTPHATPELTASPVAIPYVSPGPYVVEYPYKYTFIINEPQTCEQEKPFVVLMVPVAPHNKQHRDIIRSTWGGESPVRDRVVKLFFLLGLPAGGPDGLLAEQLQQESREHHDLIQSNFLDCYKNLTIKTMVMLEWLDSHCSSTSYAMKVDSDMFLNVPNLIGLLLRAPKTNYMTGLVAAGAQVLRDKNSKWYLPWELFPEPSYPPYALGLGYILSLDLPKKLIEASKHVKPLYIEDVYLGLCMRYLGIRPTNPPDWGLFNVLPLQYSRCAFSRIIATTTPPNMDRLSIWRDFKRPGSYC
ncbi:beta-1,3-galactosyltransferase 1-like [Parambassis ranga]|uniref:Hexosyltransferase n=1 Tax=Parambassis ranga TaxID=210632 RepID=A0A6P7HMB5_9TELE|nr:beta-1,3-galactosyltransferase 1-like [Parambassis ranga]